MLPVETFAPGCEKSHAGSMAAAEGAISKSTPHVTGGFGLQMDL